MPLVPTNRGPLAPPAPGPQMAGPPMAGPPMPPGPLAPPPLGGSGMGAPGFPSTDPSQIAPLLAPIIAAGAQDQAALQQQQMEAAALALIDAMRNQPNPAAQAAVSEPGYPTPPPPIDDSAGLA